MSPVYGRAPGREGARRIVVIGNGMVCQRLCRELARYGVSDVTILGDEPYPAYDRIGLSKSLNVEIEDLQLAPLAWYQQQGFELRIETTVTRIDRQRRRVELAEGEPLAYDTLVLATGSTPVIPAGLALPETIQSGPQVRVFRNFADLEHLRRLADTRVRFAVLGGGLLGLETAKVLLEQGCDVHVVEASDYLMSRQLDPDSAALLQRRVTGLGIALHLGKRTRSVTAEHATKSRRPGLQLHFVDEDTLQVDHLVIATGVRPRDGLARAAGLSIGARGGIMVDDHLQTSDPHIFAIGECASHRGVVFGLVAPGNHMADVLAMGLAGRTSHFTGGDNSCHLKLLGVPVCAVGNYDQEATLISFEGDDHRRTLMLDGRRLIGASAVGRWPQLPRVQDAIGQRHRLSESQLRRFQRDGEIFGPSDLTSACDWPASTIVCNCENVTRGAISSCVAAGATDIATITARSGAGGVCGSCKPLLAQMLGSAIAPNPSLARRTVLALSTLAALSAVGLFLLKPLAVAVSIQGDRYRVDQWLSDDLLKQCTGFGLLCLAAIGGLLSARKRLGWFSLGSFNSYRVLHTATGLFTLVGLIAHTGLRFGENLNFWLATLFIGLGLVGALTGIATSLESSAQPRIARKARALRRPLTWGHLMLFWPLPLLAGLHVFSSYYF